MSRRTLFPWLLVAAAILVLAQIFSDFWSGVPLAPDDVRYVIILLVFVAFVVSVEMPLQVVAISLGYGAGLMAYLTLGNPGEVYVAFFVIALGSVAGGLLRAWWRHREAERRRFGLRVILEWLEPPATAFSQMILGLAAGHVVYRLVGGRLPLFALGWGDLIPLTLMAVVSLTVYLAIYAVSLWAHHLKPVELLKRNAFVIGVTLVSPIPMVIAAALLFPASHGGFVLLALGLMIMAIGATELGRAYLEYRQQFAELQSLSAVNRTMRTHLDLDALLSTIHVQVASLLGVDSFSLALYDPASNVVNFPMVIHKWQRMAVPEHELGMDLVDHVIASQGPLLLSGNPVNQAKALGLVPPEASVTSWLGVPLLAPDRALGCISVTADDPDRRFTERDQRLLVAVATQSSIAIENAQLYQHVQERASQLARLNTLSAQLSGTLDPQRVLDIVAESMSLICGSASAAIYLWQNSPQRALTLAQGWRLSADFTADPPRPLLQNGSVQPLVVQNVQNDARVTAQCEAMLRDGIHAWIELPLSNGQNQIGILIGYYRAPRRFSGEEIELLKTFSNQAALAVSNARLYRQTDEALARRVEQLSALAVINKEFASTLNLDRVFDLVLDRAIEATGSSQGTLLINDAQDGQPRIVASQGTPALPFDQLIQHTAIQQAYATGKPALSMDRPDGSLSQLAAPIVRNDVVQGVIILSSAALDAYRQDDINFVSQLAAQATIAMGNAFLFEWMKNNRNRLQVILDSMHEAVIMFELDGRVDLANPRVEMLLEIDPILIAGLSLESLLARPGLDFAQCLGFEPGALETLFRAVRSGQWQDGGRFSYRLERVKTYFIDRTIVQVLDPNNKAIGILMVFTDATEERELAQAREDLSRMIVHDLRSPLTAINASMKLLNEMVSPDQSVGSAIQKTTEVSQRALRKLLHLIDSLLDIAKMESGNITLEMEPTNLFFVAESVRLELTPLAEELDIRIDIVMAPDLPELVLDAHKIERVMLNLVDNALKYAPVGGLIQIHARRDGPERIRVEVSDNGPGVPDDYKKRIFDRFQQADQRGAHRRGTGLGLTFCKLTVEAHGGTIWIEDNPGGGSIFAFTLSLEQTLSIQRDEP